MGKSHNDFQQTLQIQNFKSLWLTVTKLLNFEEIPKDEGVAAYLTEYFDLMSGAIIEMSIPSKFQVCLTSGYRYIDI